MNNSNKAFKEILENGSLAEMQDRVLRYIKASGPICGRDISACIPGGHKRVSELKDIGCIKRHGTRRHPVTGKMVDTWVYVGRGHKQMRKRISKAQIMSEVYDHGILGGVELCITLRKEGNTDKQIRSIVQRAME